MAIITHKRGDTFELTLTLENQGNAVDITLFTIACQVRDQEDALIQALTVTKTDPTNGVFTLTAADTETDDWPLLKLDTDVEFIEPDATVSSSETFNIQVIKDITRV
tara:strand:+ start:251 stop:571 length:321 start_codon:yes stop_codon:yes gene_type:complete